MRDKDKNGRMYLSQSQRIQFLLNLLKSPMKGPNPTAQHPVPIPRCAFSQGMKPVNTAINMIATQVPSVITRLTEQEVGKLLTKAGEKLSKVPIIGKFGAESLTNILADTTLDTAIDTIPSMVEIAMDGGSAGEVALEGLKRTGINLGANGAFETVFKVGKGVLGGTGEGGLKRNYNNM